MFPRQVDKKCQEETCTFKGKATGKDFVGRFVCNGSSLSGLAASSSKANQDNLKADTYAGDWLKSLYSLYNQTFIVSYANSLESKLKLNFKPLC